MNEAVNDLVDQLIKMSDRADKYQAALVTIKENVERANMDAHLKHCILATIELALKK